MIKYKEVLTKISVHPLFWVIIVIGIFTARFKELLLLFCIVLIHELGHAFAAAHYNWRIKKFNCYRLVVWLSLRNMEINH